MVNAMILAVRMIDVAPICRLTVLEHEHVLDVVA